MTKLLYLYDCYRKDCEAIVVDSGESPAPFVILDQTIFYPTGGGQEHDTGIITYEGGEVMVTDVRKENGLVRHYVSAAIQKGTKVRCSVDWPRRYTQMRMHTSQHTISAVGADLFGAFTVGNQIHPERSRVDFKPAVSKEQLKLLEDQTNAILSQNMPVTIKDMNRDEALKLVNPKRTNVDLVPDVPSLRMVSIGTWDVCPCGGTHVANTKEVGLVRIVESENKGKGVGRVAYVLSLNPPDKQ